MVGVEGAAKSKVCALKLQPLTQTLLFKSDMSKGEGRTPELGEHCFLFYSLLDSWLPCMYTDSAAAQQKWEVMLIQLIHIIFKSSVYMRDESQTFISI